jgi:NADPH:quinone reductase-like Zn-dependent oxidoreductase
LGYEAAGVVDAIGPGLSSVKIGDRVSTIPAFGLSAHGVYGESAVVPAHAVARYPAHFSPEQGAAVWMQFMTAWIGLIEKGQIEKGQIALITAASSSVGLPAIQIAKATGALTIAATRKVDKRARLLDLGTDCVGLKSGALKPILDPKVFTLDEIVDAHRYMESNDQFGKIVVKV